MTKNQLSCTLCDSSTYLFKKYKHKSYYRCTHCDAILLHPKYYLNKIEEKAFYQTHNNDVEDKRYQDFVSPIVRRVLSHYNKTHIGLDYGAGTGPVISKLLNDKGYKTALYDPFFWNIPNSLKTTYHYIVSCEVIEHFHFPKKEFQLLCSLLKEKGSLILMTYIYNDKIDFDKWYYKNDPTHVIFYTKNTFTYIKKNYGFTRLAIKNRLVHLYSS